MRVVQNKLENSITMQERESEILVAIHCLVYNHEPYLRDCFEGFVMQKTSFRFVAIVHEDCSTDHSADIIREYEAKYPDIFRPIYETENQYSKPDGSLGRIMNAAIDATGAKYIAMCEGDDYWTDPYKLQKQVDFLEIHPEYVACGHRFVEYYEDTKQFSKSDHWTKVIMDDMLGIELNKVNYFQIGLLPQILTTVYRKAILEEQSPFRRINTRSQYDQTMYYALVQEAPIWIMNEQMGVYRRHSGGIATSIKGTLEAERKMYITWKDVYEVYQTEETRQMYVSNLESYLYRYIKRSKSLDKKECKELLAECKELYGGYLPVRLRWRMAKAYLLRAIIRN